MNEGIAYWAKLALFVAIGAGLIYWGLMVPVLGLE